MILWFAGLSVVLVWAVFRSPALDYRLVALAALVPVAEAALGGPRLTHTLLAAVVVLVVVMAATRHRRLLRRRLIALPIGLMMHLVLDGTWTDAEVFWWPAFGWSLPGGGPAALDRPVAVVVLQEVVGLAALWWCWRAFALHEPEHRERLWRTGQLPRPRER